MTREMALEYLERVETLTVPKLIALRDQIAEDANPFESLSWRINELTLAAARVSACRAYRFAIEKGQVPLLRRQMETRAKFPKCTTSSLTNAAEVIYTAALFELYSEIGEIE